MRRGTLLVTDYVVIGGVSVAAAGLGEIRQPRMNQLVRQKGKIRERTFEIEFLDPGVAGFSFTFG